MPENDQIKIKTYSLDDSDNYITRYVQISNYQDTVYDSGANITLINLSNETIKLEGNHCDEIKQRIKDRNTSTLTIEHNGDKAEITYIRATENEA